MKLTNLKKEKVDRILSIVDLPCDLKIKTEAKNIDLKFDLKEDKRLFQKLYYSLKKGKS